MNDVLPPSAPNPCYRCGAAMHLRGGGFICPSGHENPICDNCGKRTTDVWAMSDEGSAVRYTCVPPAGCGEGGVAPATNTCPMCNGEMSLVTRQESSVGVLGDSLPTILPASTGWLCADCGHWMDQH